MKSFVRIGRNFKAKMALNNKEWHVKTYIHQSVMKISITHSQFFCSLFSWRKAFFCSSIVVKIYIYHQSWRENMKITVNIKVIK